VASSAPTMQLSLPASASIGVRASGASTRRAPAAAQVSRSFAVESGSLVEQSTITRPRLAPASRPDGPVSEASTCGEPVTQRKTISLAAASSAAELHSFAPAASRSATPSRLRCTVSESAWPLAIRFFAMPWPINPDAPMNPIAAIRFASKGGGALCEGWPPGPSVMTLCGLVCRLDPGNDLRRLHGARLARDLLAVAEENQGRDAADAESRRRQRAGVAVDLGEDRLALQSTRRLLELRRHRAA